MRASERVPGLREAARAAAELEQAIADVRRALAATPADVDELVGRAKETARSSPYPEIVVLRRLGELELERYLDRPAPGPVLFTFPTLFGAATVRSTHA